MAKKKNSQKSKQVGKFMIEQMSSRTGMPFLPVHIATSSWQHSPRWV
jgi:hypothetical protein